MTTMRDWTMRVKWFDRPGTQTIWFDLPAHETGKPGPGDYLVSRRKDGRWGTAYLILGARLVKRRKPEREPEWRRFSLKVQKQPTVTPDVLRLARWFLRWNPRHRTQHPPALLKTEAK